MPHYAQIARIDQPIEELVYDGTEGFVIELDGSCIGQASTLAEATQIASAKLGVTQFERDAEGDAWGRQTWTAKL